MSKVTTVTTSYTSDIVVNGTTVSADKIYANGTQVRRCIVNGKDVIHKSVRTVVKVSSDLTFNIEVSFTVHIRSSRKYYFNSPIKVSVTVIDNGSSGFNQVELLTITPTFYCAGATHGYYETSLHYIYCSIGQTQNIEFEYFTGLLITTSQLDEPYCTLYMEVLDQDEVQSSFSILADYKFETSYSFETTQQRVIDKTLSDDTVQEY